MLWKTDGNKSGRTFAKAAGHGRGHIFRFRKCAYEKWGGARKKLFSSLFPIWACGQAGLLVFAA